MKLPNIKGLAGITKAFVIAHRPELLFGASVVSTVGAVVASGAAGYKTGQQVLRAEYPELDLESPEGKTAPLDFKGKVQLTWLNYLPAAGLTAGALGATTGLHIVHIKEKKALAAAALMAIEEIRNEAIDYKQQILEIVDDQDKKPAEKVRDIDEVTSRVTMVDADQLYLVKDEFTGRTFYSTENKVQNAVNEVNSLLNTRDVELNSFYVWAGVPEIQDGDEYGWNAGDFIVVKWEDTHLDDGRPVRAFTFQPKPRKGYEAGPQRHSR